MSTSIVFAHDVRRARRAFLWVGLIVPLAIIAVATILVAAWLPEIPDPAATHWGSDGVNGSAPSWIYIVLCAGLGGGIVVLIAVFALSAHRLPQHGRTHPQQWPAAGRFLGGVSLGFAALIATISLVGVGAQRGLADAADAPDISGWVLLGLLGMTALAVAGWFLQPRVPADADAPTEAATPIDVAPGERIAWFGTAAMGRPGIVALTLSVLIMVATTVFTLAVSGDGGWILALVTLLLVILIATTLVFRVRISAKGLQVRSVVGWPRWNVRADEVEDVRVVEVDPMGEFGGWGLRIGVDGRRGIVLRTGEALQVTRASGRVLVVTIDDARTAAAVLTAAAARSSAAHDPASSTDRGESA